MAPRGLGALLAIAAALSGLKCVRARCKYSSIIHRQRKSAHRARPGPLRPRSVAWGAAFNVTDLRERREAGDGVIFMLLSQLQDVLNAPDRTADVVVLLQAGQAGVNTMGQLLFQRLSQAVEEYKRTHSERAAQEIEARARCLQFAASRVTCSPFPTAPILRRATGPPSPLRPQMYRQDLEYLKQVPRVMEEQSREFRVAARSFHRSLAETGREDAIFFVELPESDMTFK